MKELIAIAIFATIVMSVDLFAFSQKPKEMTVEMRLGSAQIHEGIAKCLRSNKSVSDCNNEIKTQCNQIMGEAKCSMKQGNNGQIQSWNIINESAPSAPRNFGGKFSDQHTLKYK